MSESRAESNENRPSQLVVVSNRRPFTVKHGPDGPVVERSAGGLVAAVYPLMESTGGAWIAWEGEDVARGREGIDSARTREPGDEHAFCRLVPLRLSAREVQNYYYGFSNRALWPLCHLFIGRSHFDPDQFRDYVRVNQKFADATAKVASRRDRIWIHDYHLALVPDLLRERSGTKLGPIGLFWHIPFPPWDVFRALPWSRQILQGMLGADLVGFHVEDYAENFRKSVRKGLGLEQDGSDILRKDGRRVKVGAFPIGIDAEKIETVAASPQVSRRVQQIRDRLHAEYLVLAVDRLDYSKGILERLQAVERFFERYPKRRGKVVFAQVAVPSRTRVEEYRAIKRSIEEAVGRINGRLTEEGVGADTVPLSLTASGRSHRPLPGGGRCFDHPSSRWDESRRHGVRRESGGGGRRADLERAGGGFRAAPGGVSGQSVRRYRGRRQHRGGLERTRRIATKSHGEDARRRAGARCLRLA